jgi:hypothetical protein
MEFLHLAHAATRSVPTGKVSERLFNKAGNQAGKGCSWHAAKLRRMGSLEPCSREAGTLSSLHALTLTCWVGKSRLTRADVAWSIPFRTVVVESRTVVDAGFTLQYGSCHACLLKQELRAGETARK